MRSVLSVFALLLATTSALSIQYAEASELCRAKVLHDVPAVESPTSILSAGKELVDVSQYVVDGDKNGQTEFCAHGDYCYQEYADGDPAHGVAIQLENCIVDKSKPDIDGKQTTYSLVPGIPGSSDTTASTGGGFFSGLLNGVKSLASSALPKPKTASPIASSNNGSDSILSLVAEAIKNFVPTVAGREVSLDWTAKTRFSPNMTCAEYEKYSSDMQSALNIADFVDFVDITLNYLDYMDGLGFYMREKPIINSPDEALEIRGITTRLCISYPSAYLINMAIDGGKIERGESME